MEKKRINFLALVLVALVMTSLCASFVAAEDLVLEPNEDGTFTISLGKSGGAHEPVENPEWLLGTMNFFNWGVTWADLIVSLAVLVMVFAFMYDALSFTTIETDWAKYTFAIGVSLITAMIGLNGAFITFILKLVGGSAVVGTLLIVIIAILGMVGGSWLKRKKKLKELEHDVAVAEGGFKLQQATTKAEIAKAKAAAKAAKTP